MWMNTVRRPADLSQELGGGHRVHADDRHQAWKAGLTSGSSSFPIVSISMLSGSMRAICATATRRAVMAGKGSCGW